MKRNFGFTLVELLVVIAIISILAAIVTPRVQGYILRSRMTAAEAEIRGIEVALTKLLTDVNKDNLSQLFTGASYPAEPADSAALQTQIAEFTDVFYAILRQGRNADLTGYALQLDPEVRNKMGTSYLDLGLDPWDTKYQFWVGPFRVDIPNNRPMPFRAYRAGSEAADGSYYGYDYSTNDTGLDANGNVVNNINRKQEADARIPGNPPADNRPGYPAPRDMTIYLYSIGVNKQVNQNFGTNPAPFSGLGEDRYKGGGDDINNWDKENGWSVFYT